MRMALPCCAALAAAALLHAWPAMAQRADFANQAASQDARHVADWAVHSGDHRSR
jgi:hypothetical protein